MKSREIDPSGLSSFILRHTILYLADFNLASCGFSRFHLIVILKKKSKIFIQHLIVQNDYCIIWNLEKTEKKTKLCQLTFSKISDKFELFTNQD